MRGSCGSYTARTRRAQQKRRKKEDKKKENRRRRKKRKSTRIVPEVRIAKASATPFAVAARLPMLPLGAAEANNVISSNDRTRMDECLSRQTNAPPRTRRHHFHSFFHKKKTTTVLAVKPAPSFRKASRVTNIPDGEHHLNKQQKMHLSLFLPQLQISRGLVMTPGVK